MKKSFNITILVILSGFIIFGLIYQKKYKDMLNKYQTSISNEKAWQVRYSESESSIRSFKYTIEQYKYMNDSITLKLKNTQKELNIKDSKLKGLQYLKTELSKTDTLILNDTIFVNNFILDTTIGDQWILNHLVMSYPSYINWKTSVKSEKEVIIHANKETINPPSKFFFIRWFQKKHEIIKVDIKENNPYIESQENVFYEIIE